MPAASYSRPNNDQSERPARTRDVQPCVDLKWAYVNAQDHYLKTWRDEPVEGRTDQELRAMLRYHRADDAWSRCLRDQMPERKRARMVAALFARRDDLERRLNDGDAKIDAGLLAGKDVASWEDFWVELLREYEGVEREIAIATYVVPRGTEGEVDDGSRDSREDDGAIVE